MIAVKCLNYDEMALRLQLERCIVLADDVEDADDGGGDAVRRLANFDDDGDGDPEIESKTQKMLTTMMKRQQTARTTMSEWCWFLAGSHRSTESNARSAGI